MEWKEKGNEFFKLGAYGSAIQCYTKAIETSNSSKITKIDNSVLYSNRSAAYVLYGKPEDALKDAEECLKLKPKWGKAYGRKAKALYDLERYSEALECYEDGLTLDGSNMNLRKGVEDCEKKIREEADDYEEDKKEGDDLDDFFDEIEDIENKTQSKKEEIKQKSRFTFDHKVATESWTTQNQINRILCDKYEWNNLNPFVVLSIPHTASDHDIKRRYKKLSQLLHPDKVKPPTNFNSEQAKVFLQETEKAFDQVQKANRKLSDKKEKERILTIVERIKERIEKSRERLMKRGVSDAELGDFDEELQAEVKKEFATIEHRKLKSLDLKRKYEVREKEMKKREKIYWQGIKEEQLAYRERREERIKEWKDFAKEGEEGKKKGFEYDKTSNVKQDINKRREEERKTFKGYGIDEAYKNNWR